MTSFVNDNADASNPAKTQGNGQAEIAELKTRNIYYPGFIQHLSFRAAFVTPLDIVSLTIANLLVSK